MKSDSYQKCYIKAGSKAFCNNGMAVLGGKYDPKQTRDKLG